MEWAIALRAQRRWSVTNRLIGTLAHLSRSLWRGWPLPIAFLSAGCGAGSPALSPVPVPAQSIRTATSADSITGEWLGKNADEIAVVTDDSVTLAIAVTVGSEFATLWVQVMNRSGQSRVVNPLAVAVLDGQRIELARVRPDEVANRIASTVASAPKFTPRYIVTTDASSQVTLVGRRDATVSSTQVTRIERDPVDAAVESFAQGFAAGFNRGVLDVAQAAYREGFTSPIQVQPNSGQRGRLFFARPRGTVTTLIVRVGAGREVVFRTKPKS